MAAIGELGSLGRTCCHVDLAVHSPHANHPDGLGAMHAIALRLLFGTDLGAVRIQLSHPAMTGRTSVEDRNKQHGDNRRSHDASGMWCDAPRCIIPEHARQLSVASGAELSGLRLNVEDRAMCSFSIAWSWIVSAPLLPSNCRRSCPNATVALRLCDDRVTDSSTNRRPSRQYTGDAVPS